MRGCALINLFIDSSRENLSIAITGNDKVIAKVNTSSHGKHSNYLMNNLKEIFENNGMNIYDVDNIIVLNGPGSFTGLRVGVTVAKTIAWALSKKLYQLSTLDALKVHDSNDAVISVFYDKPSSSYVGLYIDNSNVKDYMNLDDDRLNISDNNIDIVSYENNDFVKALQAKLEKNNNVNIKIIENYDYVKVINEALLSKPVMVHNSAPIYLKKIDAEKK